MESCMCPCACKAKDDGVDTVALRDLAKELQRVRQPEWDRKMAEGKHVSTSGWMVLSKQETTDMSDTVMCGWKRKKDDDGKGSKIVVDCDQLKIPPLTSTSIIDHQIMCTKDDPSCEGDDCPKTCQMLYGVTAPETISFVDSHQSLKVECRKIEPGQFVPDNPFDPIPYGDLSYTCTIRGPTQSLQKVLHDEQQEGCDPREEGSMCTPAYMFNTSFLASERRQLEEKTGAAQPLWKDDERVHLIDYFIHMQDHDKKASYSMAVEKAGMFAECDAKGENCELGLGFEAILVKFKAEPKHHVTVRDVPI